MQIPITVYEDEKDLVAEMRSGSKAAYDKLYSHYAPMLLGYITKITEDAKLNESILEQAFVEIWQRRKEYNPKMGRIYTWMSQIARKLALAAASPKKTVPDAILNSFASVYINDDVNKKEVVYKPEAGNRVQLYELYDTILGMMHYDNKGVAQVQQQLNVPEDKIKIMLRNAINKFKTMPNE